MEKRTLGKSELRVSAMGLGCMGMSEFYGRIDDEEAYKTVHRALDLGISNIQPEGIRRAFAAYPIVALQSEYSIWDRAVEPDVIPVCRELGIGFVCYSPLGRGALTGRIKDIEALDKDDARRIHPRFLGENFQKNLLLVNRIEELAREKGCSPAQISLAWLLVQGEDIVPIPGTKNLKYLEENIRALDINLTAEDLARINEAAPAGTVAGAPYPERH